MAAKLSYHLPIIAVSTLSGNQEKIQNVLEAASQTFVQGTPVKLNSSGNTVAATAGSGSAQEVFYGISALRGKNLSSAGLGASPLYGSITPPWGQGAVQDVVNEPNAYSVFHGAPFLDGLTLVQVANLDTIFEIQVDASTGSTYNATTALVGSTIALNVDGNGFWYADLANVNASNYADLTVLSLNPLDLVAGSTTTQQNNGRIRVAFTTSSIQALS